MNPSPYLLFITIILAITSAYILYNQYIARNSIRIHSASAVLPEQHEPLPIVTEPPVHLQPLIEESDGAMNEGTNIEDLADVEGFADGGQSTLPTAANPFMNVMIPEIKYNPDRPDAAEVDDPVVKQQLDDFFRTNFYNDPTDVFGRNQSQRQFVTQPSTSIPNDRESYQNWLYNIVPLNCKAGGRAACLPGTDGGPITSLNQAF
jgi:hypothetical protein